MRYVPPGTGCRNEEPKTRMRTGALIQGVAATPTGPTVWRGPRNNKHRLLVVVDLRTTGRMNVQEQKRTLTTSFDFSDVTLAFEDRIEDWPKA